jgi:septum formation protein
VGYLLLPAMGPYRLLAPLWLASASPRRHELLRSAGLEPVVTPVEVDETPTPRERPGAYLERVVGAKLDAALAQAGAHEPAVLVADTSVVLDERILGKPDSDDDARAMVRSLAGRSHEVRTRFALAHRGRLLEAHTVVTRVLVRPLEARAVDAYVATGEGRDKAGAYAIQGRFAACVAAIEGSYTNVVGLPLAEVLTALERAGIVEPA